MQKTWKILLVFCCALCMGLGFAACTNEGEHANEGAAQPAEDGSVLVLESGVPEIFFGETGDVCLVADTGELYRKTEGGWTAAECESYEIAENRLTVTYADGTVEAYTMSEGEASECTHDNLGAPVTVYEPLCVVPGIGVRTCPDCKESFPVILPATGVHSYEEGGYTCLVCGETNYFKDAELGKHGDTLSGNNPYSVEGKYVIREGSHFDTNFDATDGEVVIPGEIDGKEVIIDQMAFGSELKGANTTITSLVIEEGVTVIGQRAFQNCTALESVTLPESLTILGANPKDGSYSSDYLKIFAGCTSLREVHFGSKITVIGNQAFYGCSSLTSIELPQSLKEIHNAAFQNTGLTQVEIPESVEMIEKSVFKGCSSLTSFQFGKDSLKGKDGNKIINGISASLFANCTSLTEITLPEGIEEIGSSAFEGSALTGIAIPASVTAIDNYAFRYCAELASLTFEAESKLKSIGSNAFYCGGNNQPRNEKLQTVILPEGLETIGKTAFGCCTALESIVLPSTLTSLGSDKFDAYYGPFYNTKLTYVFYSGTQADWESKVENYEKLQFGDKLVFFSNELQPGYWHWDGEVPKLWE